MNFKTANVAGLKIFYREAGDPSKPNIVLLHGFPSSSYSFHDLIPPLADRFHVIAPDYPGMGYSEAPAPAVMRPTFDEMVVTIDAFIAQCAPGPVILYMHDIGGPVGMRIATAHPDRIAGLIFQNFTISIEGWNPERLKVYERLGSPETPDNLAEIEQFATVERDRFLHKRGARRPDDLNPDYWAIDAYTFSIPASRIFMSRLFMTLATNIKLYPQWTAYLKDWQPKTLIVWGQNDPLILPAAAEFVKQVVPAADLRYFDGGHFVLDEYADAIAEAIIETFPRWRERTMSEPRRRTMNQLAKQAIDAHGGLERWRRFTSLSAHLIDGGVLWAAKGKAGVLADVTVTVDLLDEKASHTPFGSPDRRSRFEPQRVAIEDANGKVLEELLQPRASFQGHAATWSDLQVAYFAGYAMWTYLNIPFLLARPGVESEEVEPWQESGETWRRLKVRFPADIATHSTEQTLYLDRQGLLRRLDYNVEIDGTAGAAHYVYDHKEFSGIVFPTKRRVFGRQPDGRPAPEPLIISIDLDRIVLS